MGSFTGAIPITGGTSTNLFYWKIEGVDPPVEVSVDANVMGPSTMVQAAFLVDMNGNVVEAPIRFLLPVEFMDQPYGDVPTNWSNVYVTPPDDEDYFLLVVKG